MATIQAIIDKYSDRLLVLENVVGVGEGRRDGKPVIVVFVTRKLPRRQLDAAQVIPGELRGYQTDVVEIGVPQVEEPPNAQQDPPNG